MSALCTYPYVAFTNMVVTVTCYVTAAQRSCKCRSRICWCGVKVLFKKAHVFTSVEQFHLS